MSSPAATRRSRAFGAFTSSRNPRTAVYGTVAVGLVFAAEDPAHETYRNVLEAALAAVATYWIAHGYAEWLGSRIKSDAGEQRRWSLHDLADELRHEWVLAEVSVLPIIAVIVAWLCGASVKTGLLAALWVAATMLVVFEVVTGVARKLPVLEILRNAAFGACIGLGVFAVKALL